MEKQLGDQVESLRLDRVMKIPTVVVHLLNDICSKSRSYHCLTTKRIKLLKIWLLKFLKTKRESS